LLGRHLDQHAPRFGGGGAHLLAAPLHPGRAGGAALVHAGGGVPHHHRDAAARHVELFRHALADGGEQPLPPVHRAEEGRYGAVGLDRDVGVELARDERRLAALRGGRIDRQHGVESDRHADRDHQRARAFEQRAAGEVRHFFHSGHGGLPQPIISAARFTARRIAPWGPPRQFRPHPPPLIPPPPPLLFPPPPL